MDSSLTPLDTVPAPPMKPSRARRWLRRLGWAVVWLATAIALFYAVENWRGRRAWNAYVAELRARGDSVEPAAVIPPPVPDAENFALTPIFSEYLEKEFAERAAREKGNFQPRQELDFEVALGKLYKYSKVRPPTGARWRVGMFEDLRGWQTFFRTQPGWSVAAEPQEPEKDILLALSVFDDEFRELDDAKSRPYSRFPLPYDEIGGAIGPHAGLLAKLSRVIGLRCSARLVNNEIDAAYEDLLLCLRMGESLAEEPAFSAAVVRLSMSGLPIQPLWEGLVRHQWSEAQLAAVDAQLATVNLADHFQHILRGDRNLIAFAWLDLARREPDKLWNKSSWPSFGARGWLREKLDSRFEREEWPFQLGSVIFSLIPSGWYDQSKLYVGRGLDQMMTAIDPTAKRFFPDRAARYEKEMLQWNVRTLPSDVVYTRLTWRNTQGISGKFAFAQGNFHLARLAIALERYRIRHGDYPETLASLDPEFVPAGGLPTDPATGTAAHYTRNSQERFTLYFDGWNGTDDGGNLGLYRNDAKRKPEERRLDRSVGDWVWPQPLL